MFQRQSREPFPVRNIIVLAAVVLLFLLFLLNQLKKKEELVAPAPVEQSNR